MRPAPLLFAALFAPAALPAAVAATGSYEIVTKEILIIDTPVKNGRYEAEVACPRGKKALSAVVSLPVVLPNWPKDDGSAWQFTWAVKDHANPGLEEAIQANGNRFYVRIVCANIR